MGRHTLRDEPAEPPQIGALELDQPSAPEDRTVVDDGPAAARQPQPVLTASAVQAVLAALVTLGWLQLDDAALSTIATAVAALAALAVALVARSKVTPTNSPRDSAGRPLTP